MAKRTQGDDISLHKRLHEAIVRMARYIIEAWFFGRIRLIVLWTFSLVFAAKLFFRQLPQPRKSHCDVSTLRLLLEGVLAWADIVYTLAVGR